MTTPHAWCGPQRRGPQRRKAGALPKATAFFPVGHILALLAAGFLTCIAHAQTDPAAEQASFRVLDGFEVNLFASEREGVRKPIQIRFDPDGRLWVVGSVVYPQVKPGENPDDQVLVLDDTDHDGRADRSTVFAGGLQIPTGIELGDGGVYVGAATELLHFRDTDGDGKADERRVVLRGFGTGDTHQTINSFTWGPSGELMMSQGLHAESRVETPWGIETLRQAGVWRFWPRSVRLEAFWTGAMGAHNPFGNVFDHWGQPIVLAGNGHGIYHLTQAMIPTDHFLEQRSIWNQGRKFGGGDFVENGHWPEAQQGDLVSGGYLQNTVERFRLTDDGATFKAERLPPLIESTNTAFRIVDVRFGPDGALYLCDWYNPIIGHYQASFRDPARDQAHGRIWRVTAKGRARVNWQPLSRLPTSDLVARLGSSERWERQMARRVLSTRAADETATALRAWLGHLPSGVDPEHARFEALGAFANLDLLETNLLVQVANSPQTGARAYAARVTGLWARTWGPDQTDFPLTLLEKQVRDPQPRVRLEAVVACSFVPDSKAVEVAAQVFDQPMESALEYAFTQCVHALRRWWEPARARGDLRFGGETTRAAAFARASGGAAGAQYAAGRLRRVSEVALEEDTVRQLSEVVANSGGPGDLTALLNPRAFTLGTNYVASLQAQRLQEAVESSRRRGVRPEGDLAPALSKLLESPDLGVRVAALRAVGVWKVGSLRSRLAQSLDQPNPTSEERVAAIKGLAAFGDPPALQSLIRASSSDSPTPERAAAIAEMVAADPKQAAAAAASWFNGQVDTNAVSQIANAFLRQRDGLSALTGALRVNPPSSAVAQGLREQLARSGQHDPSLDAVLSAATGGSRRSQGWSATDYPTVIKAVRAGGNPSRGAQIFLRPQLACTTCHSINGAPGKVGPDLGALGTAQTLDFIVGAIVEPQKEVKEGFMASEVITRDGTVYQGYLRGEEADSLTIVDHLSGQTVRLPRETIVEQRQLGTLMPSGLVDGLSADELRDLVSYLQDLGRK
ncbi:MAG TPA: HEAT repeat domain-containing protein [Verrucomicrobiota bacterium]|nr:HEAT repeat domain-containing protein [Verrucomicrobiota bacterium]